MDPYDTDDLDVELGVDLKLITKKMELKTTKLNSQKKLQLGEHIIIQSK